MTSRTHEEQPNRKIKKGGILLINFNVFGDSTLVKIRLLF